MVGGTKAEVPEVELTEDEDSQEAHVQKAVERKKLQPDERMPPINVPEKIFLCLDVTPSCSKISLYPGKDVEPLLLLKQSILIFINNKLNWNPQTQISIILLNGSSAVLYCPFTDRKDKLIENIKRIHVPPGDGDTSMEDDEEDFCLDEFLKLMMMNVELPECQDKKTLPAFIARGIFFYGRTKFLSIRNSMDKFKMFIDSPYFIFDSLFLHEDELDESVRVQIISTLSKLDNGYSYILETDNSAVNFMNAFSLLSSHPLQRPHQSDFKDDIMSYKKSLSS
nr:PREDICTED: BRISC and BRCA1-A complex member 1-like [Bemisia tabaci]XP_018904809.1 PREDICTED: BRISC and BRCA1-A complex member 1-like [Bemisia tabaci]